VCPLCLSLARRAPTLGFFRLATTLGFFRLATTLGFFRLATTLSFNAFPLTTRSLFELLAANFTARAHSLVILVTRAHRQRSTITVCVSRGLPRAAGKRGLTSRSGSRIRARLTASSGRPPASRGLLRSSLRSALTGSS
jgi:hypothetical protein